MHVLYLIIKYFAVKFVGNEQASIYFTNVYFDPWKFKGWSRLRIFLVYGFPSFFVAFAALGAALPFQRINRDNSRLKIFTLWFMICGGVFFATDFFKAPFFEGTMASVYQWFFISTELAFLISILFMPIIVGLGYVASRIVIKTANSRKDIKTRPARMIYFATTMLIPAVIVFGILGLMMYLAGNYPLSSFVEREVFRIGFIIISLVLGVLFSNTKKYVNIRKSSNLPYIKKEISVMITVVIIGIFFLLYF